MNDLHIFACCVCVFATNCKILQSKFLKLMGGKKPGNEPPGRHSTHLPLLAYVLCLMSSVFCKEPPGTLTFCLMSYVLCLLE
jgi:hypothetical protein